MKRVIISDLHIGSKYANEEALISFLSSLDCDELILAGDIIDFIKIPSFTPKAHSLFKIMHNFNRRIVYIIGNHDISFEGLDGKSAFGVLFTKKYSFVDSGKRYKVEHGHTYDRGVVHWKFFIKIVSICQDLLERWLNINLTAWFRNLRKRKLRRIWDIIKWNEDADVFIMGHTHTPEVLIWVDQDENIKTYVNCGDWVEHSTYVVVENGVTRLKKWKLGRTTD